ncbi:MAG: OmpA family protein [Xanthomonadales bacterium]|nr:OmpA family protein [Dehalococcoidia bacterium]MDW8479136.1 OmpA family protein [Xanthomonadales bacterium]
MSDLMSALLFIFIITLAVFALRLAEARRNMEQAEAALTSATSVRILLLEAIRRELAKRGIDVEIEFEHGILRLTDRAIRFPRGEAVPYPDHHAHVGAVARVLRDVLSCYAHGRSTPALDGLPPPPAAPFCLPPAPFPDPPRCEEAIPGVRVDTVLIEGHTDNVPLVANPRYKDNLDLSAGRAAEVYRMMTSCEPDLASLVNKQGAPILNVAGYGESRPLDPKRPDADVNRRIDLRFLMESPRPRKRDAPPVPQRVLKATERAVNER